MFNTARTNAKTMVQGSAPRIKRSTFHLTLKLGKAIVISCIRRRYENPVGLRQSLVSLIAKVLGIDKPAERHQKPKIPVKGQHC